MGARKRKCKNEGCSEWYEPFNTLQQVCGPRCALSYGKVLADRKARRELRAARKNLKTRSAWTREAQAAFNAYIRERDRALRCVSCDGSPSDAGLLTGSKWDCGHYRSIGANPELRFEELNAAKQCVKCNRELSGNTVNYRTRLLERIGAEKLALLEGPHEPKRYTIEGLMEIKQEYQRKLKELRS